MDHEVVEMWKNAEWSTFCEMLPEYAAKGHGEGFMHDTAMLLGLLGWSEYDQAVDIITPYFASSGTGEINAIFPISPQSSDAIPEPQATIGKFTFGDSRL